MNGGWPRPKAMRRLNHGVRQGAQLYRFEPRIRCILPGLFLFL
jgi:hypothetical protein